MVLCEEAAHDRLDALQINTSQIVQEESGSSRGIIDDFERWEIVDVIKLCYKLTGDSAQNGL